MTHNVGTTDRILRAAVAAVAIMIAVAVGAGSPAGILLLIVAVVMLVTAALRTCPLYRLLGIDSCAIGRRRGADRPSPADR